MDYVEVHPANQGENGKLAQVVDVLPVKPLAVLTDKGFASQANQQQLKERGIGDLCSTEVTITSR